MLFATTSIIHIGYDEYKNQIIYIWNYQKTTAYKKGQDIFEIIIVIIIIK